MIGWLHSHVVCYYTDKPADGVAAHCFVARRSRKSTTPFTEGIGKPKRSCHSCHAHWHGDPDGDRIFCPLNSYVRPKRMAPLSQSVDSRPSVLIGGFKNLEVRFAEVDQRAGLASTLIQPAWSVPLRVCVLTSLPSVQPYQVTAFEPPAALYNSVRTKCMWWFPRECFACRKRILSV